MDTKGSGLGRVMCNAVTLAFSETAEERGLTNIFTYQDQSTTTIANNNH